MPMALALKASPKNGGQIVEYASPVPLHKVYTTEHCALRDIESPTDETLHIGL